MIVVMVVLRWMAIGVLCSGIAAGAVRHTMQGARDLYYRGIYGEREASVKADEAFTELHEGAPNDPLISVYFGSLRLLEAEHTWALWKKHALSKQGIQLMDKAVAQAPANLEIRFVRAATERSLPSFFGRKEQAAQDLSFIVAKAHDAVDHGHFEPRLAAASFYYYGEWCRDQSRLGDAEQAWKTAVQIAPESHGARKSSEELNKLANKG